MGGNIIEVKRDIKNLLQNQPLAVLSTVSGNQPYASLVAFASSNDLAKLYFATIRSTRKFANISKNNLVAMLIDNRTNSESDFKQAMAVTATGNTKEVPQDEWDKIAEQFLAKHPSLKNFVQAPTCALCEIRIHTYFVVTRFQNVVEVHIKA